MNNEWVLKSPRNQSMCAEAGFQTNGVLTSSNMAAVGRSLGSMMVHWARKSSNSFEHVLGAVGSPLDAIRNSARKGGYSL